MWYSMIGCLLTVFLGWLISLAIDFIQRRNVLKITGKGIDNPAISEEVFKSDSQVQYTTSISVSTVTTSVMDTKEPTSDTGHVNHAIRIDDE